MVLKKTLDLGMGDDKLCPGSSLREILNIHMFGSCFLVGYFEKENIYEH